MKRGIFFSGAVALLCMSCTQRPASPVVICDFDNTCLSLYSPDNDLFSVQEVNGNLCGYVKSVANRTVVVSSPELEKPLALDSDGSKFTMRVSGSPDTAVVTFRLWGPRVPLEGIRDTCLLKSDEWTEVSFDYSDRMLADGKFNRFDITFKVIGTDSTAVIRFDDLTCTQGDARPDVMPEGRRNYSSYETGRLHFKSDGASVDVVPNPLKDGIYRSSLVARIGMAKDSANVSSEYLYDPFILSKDKSFSVKVFPPESGGKLTMSLTAPGKDTVQLATVELPQTHEWTKAEYSYAGRNLPDGIYNTIVLGFEGKGQWYIDDVEGPDNARPSLMKRLSSNPVLTYGPEYPVWRCEHIANAAILEPEQTPDGKWRMYIRGSGYNDKGEYHDQICLFTQDADKFNPAGPWDEHPNDPIIHHGEPGTFDELHLLDCAPCVGDDAIYFYYHGVSGTVDNKHSSLGCRRSIDDGVTFSEAVMLRDRCGPSDAIYLNGKYHIFHLSSRKHLQGICYEITENPLSLENSVEIELITSGNSPDNFDTRSINGARIFRLKDVGKWFMTYQGSDRKVDFPHRFHVAYSDDFVHWTKVQNPVPFFQRGEAGTWDQGGIWYPECFEHDGNVYMYYEGWGTESYVPDRDADYFAWGHSSTGCAYTSKDEFLRWCGLK